MDGRLRLFPAAAALSGGRHLHHAFFQERRATSPLTGPSGIYRKGISISADGTSPRPPRLTARCGGRHQYHITDSALKSGYIDGDHNGLNYMAYTYYVRNAARRMSYIARLHRQRLQGRNTPPGGGVGQR